MESPQRKEQTSGALSDMQIYRNVQARLMLLELLKEHDEYVGKIDVHHPRQNPRDIQAAAFTQWNEKRAEPFARYAQEHGDEEVDMESDADLERLLEEIRTYH